MMQGLNGTWERMLHVVIHTLQYTNAALVYNWDNWPPCTCDSISSLITLASAEGRSAFEARRPSSRASEYVGRPFRFDAALRSNGHCVSICWHVNNLKPY